VFYNARIHARAQKLAPATDNLLSFAGLPPATRDEWTTGGVARDFQEWIGRTYGHVPRKLVREKASNPGDGQALRNRGLAHMKSGEAAQDVLRYHEGYLRIGRDMLPLFQGMPVYLESPRGGGKDAPLIRRHKDAQTVRVVGNWPQDMWKLAWEQETSRPMQGNLLFLGKKRWERAAGEQSAEGEASAQKQVYEQGEVKEPGGLDMQGRVTEQGEAGGKRQKTEGEAEENGLGAGQDVSTAKPEARPTARQRWGSGLLLKAKQAIFKQ
jgi:hypothetical protein